MSTYYYSTWGTSTSATIMSTGTPNYVKYKDKSEKKEIDFSIKDDNGAVLFNPEDLVL